MVFYMAVSVDMVLHHNLEFPFQIFAKYSNSPGKCNVKLKYYVC